MNTGYKPLKIQKELLSILDYREAIHWSAFIIILNYLVIVEIDRIKVPIKC